MALINKLNAIGDAIREKTGKEDLLTLDQMPAEIRSISGGGNLNFKVESGNSFPSEAEENTIMIITDNTITEWLFSPEEPENPSEGMIWIQTGISSTAALNVLKDNNIIICPIFAKQYVSGAWVNKTAKSYKNGEWVDWWNGELFDNGNQWKSVTGGWVRIFYNKDTDSAIIGTDSIVIESHNGNGTVCVGLKNFNPALLAQYSNLVVEYTMARDDSTGYMSIGVVPDYDLSTSIANEWTSKTDIRIGTTSTAVAHHDISSIDVGYPMVSGYNAKVTITKVWME